MSSIKSTIERLFSKSQEQTTETSPPEIVNVSNCKDNVKNNEEIRQPAMSSVKSTIERLLSKSQEQIAETLPPETVSVSSSIDNVKDNEEISQPAGTQKLAGTVNWGTATTVAIFAGMLYGGSREAAASVSKDAEVTLKLGSTPDKREQYRLMRDAMEKRFIRVTRGSIVGGLRLGMFTAAFYGLQNLLADKRGVYDVYNIVAAGSATAATFGLIMPGPLPWRVRNFMMGSVLGATFCFPLGWAHLKLVEKANEGRLGEKQEVKSGVAAAIERLEGSLSK